jgi:hypothetical protein
MHRLADDVFAKYRPEPRLAITAARVRRAARAFKLNVVTFTGVSNDLAQQGRPPITE